jgi:hypothetical protein
MLSQLAAPDPGFSNVIDSVSKLKAHMDMAAVEWVVTMREGLRQMEINPESMLMVRYEELVNRPREVLTNLSNFCDLPHDEKFYHYAEEVLSRPPRNSQFDINPAVRPLFDETMKRLGY